MKHVKRLYKVTLKGMTVNSTGPAYGISYVIAKDPNVAYQKVKKLLEEKDIGFAGDRELSKVELIADSYEYTSCNHLLYL